MLGDDALNEAGHLISAAAGAGRNDKGDRAVSAPRRCAIAGRTQLRAAATASLDTTLLSRLSAFPSSLGRDCSRLVLLLVAMAVYAACDTLGFAV